MEYVCVDQTGKQKKKWMGEIRLIEGDGNVKIATLEHTARSNRATLPE